MTIKALRLLPPLAFARFGSAPEPQANYELEAGASLDFRRIRPQPTLFVNGEGVLTIASREPVTDNEIFRDGARIRPVAPFFELYAEVEPDSLVPVTIELLKRYELEPSDVGWKVHVENRKVLRRTGDLKDKVEATVDWFNGHERRQLYGTCENCRERIELGSVQFVRPNATSEQASHLRLRFTPPIGRIYGPFPRDVPALGDTVTAIYTGSVWPNFDNEMPGREGRPRETLPPSLYANRNEPPAAPWLNGDHAKSRGYLDDASDGFICVKIDKLKCHDGKPLQAKARICVAPPAFVPDSHFIRTLADDLDQVANGPTADDIDDRNDLRARALDIVRRAFETVRFMNVAVMNGNPVSGRPAEAFDTMPAEEAFATERKVRPVMAAASVDTGSILALHEHIFAALSSGAAPWFVRLLRRPNEAGDLTDQGRRKMPALMSGADSFYLTLTHRQIAIIEKAAAAPASAVPRNQTARRLAAQKLRKQICHKAAGNPVTARPEMAIANCCPGLEVDFRAVWRRLFVGVELSEYENYVVSAEGEARDSCGEKVDLSRLVGHRLLRVDGKPVIMTLQGPTPSDPGKKVTVRSDRNPHGVWTMEWSNCLAHVIGKAEAECEFTRHPAPEPEPLTASLDVLQRGVTGETPQIDVLTIGSEPGDFGLTFNGKRKAEMASVDAVTLQGDIGDMIEDRTKVAVTGAAGGPFRITFDKSLGSVTGLVDSSGVRVRLQVQKFFEGDTAVISERLAQAGELTQGLCSPWQNDLRECSCFYWASSRPDFVNTTIGADGLTHGDYWFARKRTGEYVADDYAEGRLMSYDDLFKAWEKLLQFQIGGKDSTDLLSAPDEPAKPPRRR